MSTRLAGTLTIGQAPRADITPILEAHWPADVRVIHMGLLDGLDREEIAARFAPKPGDALLTTRLLDGSGVVLGKPAVREILQALLDELDDLGCELVALLCTGEFHGLSCKRAWLIEPDQLVPPVVVTMAQGRQIGVMVPLPEQAASEGAKWKGLARPPIYGTATPYNDDLDALAEAARGLRARGAELLVLDCMGYTERHRACVRSASGLPTLLSNAVMARLSAELI